MSSTGRARGATRFTPPPTGDDLLSITTDYDPNGNPLEITETYDGPTAPG